MACGRNRVLSHGDDCRIPAVQTADQLSHVGGQSGCCACRSGGIGIFRRWAGLGLSCGDAFCGPGESGRNSDYVHFARIEA